MIIHVYALYTYYMCMQILAYYRFVYVSMHGMSVLLHSLSYNILTNEFFSVIHPMTCIPLICCILIDYPKYTSVCYHHVIISGLSLNYM